MLDHHLFSGKFILIFFFLITFLIFFGIYEIFAIILLPTLILVLTNYNIFLEKISNYKLLEFVLKLNQQEIAINLCILIFFVFFSKNLLLSFFFIIEAQFLKKLKLNLSIRLFNKYLSIPYINFIELSPSELLKNVMIECEQIKVLLHETIFCLKEIFVLFFIFFLFYFINSLDILTFFFVLIFFTVIFYFLIKNIIKKKGKLLQLYNTSQIIAFNNPIRSIKDTKIYNLKDFFTKIFYLKINHYENNYVFMHVFAYLPKIILETIGAFGLVIVVFALYYNNTSSEIFISKLVLLSVCFVRFVPAFSILNSAVTKFIFRKISYNLVKKEFEKYEIFKKENESSTQNILHIDNTFKIQINNLSFKYLLSDKYVFHKLNIEITSPICLGIVGESGAGKSTFIDIFLGFLTNYEGSILINGKELREVVNDWQKHLSLVSQKVFLIEDSIKENILYGSSNFDEKLFWKITEITFLDEIIDKLPNLENTHLGYDGSLVSGGQAQRIGLARALYKNRPILILDEATNALDLDLEDKILKNIKMLEKKIIIIIGHRKESLAYCDKIFSIKDNMIKKII
jgi:ABC-type bacteriocin/lantibiotic exporter with double-glycine peptidase domain